VTRTYGELQTHCPTLHLTLYYGAPTCAFLLHSTSRCSRVEVGLRELSYICFGGTKLIEDIVLVVVASAADVGFSASFAPLPPPPRLYVVLELRPHAVPELVDHL